MLLSSLAQPITDNTICSGCVLQAHRLCLSAPTMVRIEISCCQDCLVSRWETSHENQGKQKYHVAEHWVENMDHLGIWFSGGFGSARLTVGLYFGDIFQPQWFYDFQIKYGKKNLIIKKSKNVPSLVTPFSNSSLTTDSSVFFISLV